MSAGDISILGGGWSVKGEGVDVTRLPGMVIGVNDVFRYAHVDVVLSMDRLWAENRWELLKLRERTTWLRKSAVQNIKDRPYWLSVFDCDNESSDFSPLGEMRLNGANSGFCALNLAFHLRPRRLFLFGFDMRKGPNGEPYWYAPYSWSSPNGGTTPGKYRDWVKQFDTAAKSFDQIGADVYVVGERSLIDSFTKVSPDRLKELM